MRLRFLREAKDRGPGSALLVLIATFRPVRRTEAPTLGPG